MSKTFFLRELLPDNPKVNFSRFNRIAIVISSILLLATFVSIFSRSFNLGVDFTGGLLFEVKFPKQQNIQLIRKELNNLKIGEITVQTTTIIGDEISIKTAVKNKNQDSDINLIKNTILNKIDKNAKILKTEYVGAEVGNEMVKKGIVAITLTFLGITIYTWFRFNWKYAVGIALGLAHDIALTSGFLMLTKYEINLTSIAAILTVLGYSVNDTVVIYDRVREKTKLSKISNNFNALLNDSINETLSRTILTVLTTLIAVLVLIIYAGPTLKSFSITVFIGIIIGTYSSIFISLPILAFLMRNK